jgi:hypothetical protein
MKRIKNEKPRIGRFSNPLAKQQAMIDITNNSFHGKESEIKEYDDPTINYIQIEHLFKVWQQVPFSKNNIPL